MSSQQTLGFGRFLLDFVAATFRTRQRSLAAMHPVPTSSRRKRNHAQRSSRRRYVNEAVVVDNEIEIRSALYQRSSITAEISDRARTLRSAYKPTLHFRKRVLMTHFKLRKGLGPRLIPLRWGVSWQREISRMWKMVCFVFQLGRMFTRVVSCPLISLGRRSVVLRICGQIFLI